MEQPLCIKGRNIGEGKPLVCVPIMESTREGIVREASRLAERHADMIEWRVDAFEEVDSLNAVREVLAELKPLVSDMILVYTFRSARQGGLKDLPQEAVSDLHQVAAETDVVDFVDVEYFEARRPEREIALLQSMNVHVIASHHDFDRTPDREVMRMLLAQIDESGADVVKLAVMPQSGQDVLNLLEETNYFHEERPDKPLITMSMGARGAISRISGEAFGSCVTFGAGEQASAPGQLPAEELEKILTTFHECVSG